MMKKKILLFVAMLLPMVAHAYDVEVDGVYYSIIPKAKVAEVIRGDVQYSGDVDIPSSFEEGGITYRVTSIGNSAFSDCSGMTSVTIPSSVTSIGSAAFSSCRSLTSVTIPGHITILVIMLSKIVPI